MAASVTVGRTRVCVQVVWRGAYACLRVWALPAALQGSAEVKRALLQGWWNALRARWCRSTASLLLLLLLLLDLLLLELLLLLLLELLLQLFHRGQTRCGAS